jgi:hypothetical protein
MLWATVTSLEKFKQIMDRVSLKNRKSSLRGLISKAVVTACAAFGLVSHTAFPAAASPAQTRVIRSSLPVLGVTNEQLDGTVWLLVRDGTREGISKVGVGNGSAIISEAVSPDASAVAQSQNGALAIGTSNGSKSAVVLYNGSSGKYQATVPTPAAVIALAMGQSGATVYALEATKPKRTLFVFNQTHTGFSYRLPSNAVGVAPTNGGNDVWVLQSSGSLFEMSFFPLKVINRLKTSPASKLAISSDGDFVYLLKRSASGSDLTILSTIKDDTVSFSLKDGSNDIATSLQDGTIFDSIATESSTGLGVVNLSLP